MLFYNAVLDNALEISSMGIRVDAAALDEQLRNAGCDNRRNLPYHRMLLEGKLPCTIGGGIGQSRLCMLLLGKAHIGEVQSSIWDQETLIPVRQQVLHCCKFKSKSINDREIAVVFYTCFFPIFL